MFWNPWVWRVLRWEAKAVDFGSQPCAELYHRFAPRFQNKEVPHHRHTPAPQPEPAKETQVQTAKSSGVPETLTQRQGPLHTWREGTHSRESRSQKKCSREKNNWYKLWVDLSKRRVWALAVLEVPCGSQRTIRRTDGQPKDWHWWGSQRQKEAFTGFVIG